VRRGLISDPVSCGMDRFFQWLAGMGGKGVVMGIDLKRIARRTIEFWLNQRLTADGSIDNALQTGNTSADSNTRVLEPATDSYLSSDPRRSMAMASAKRRRLCCRTAANQTSANEAVWADARLG
jgi:hypothetical protein